MIVNSSRSRRMPVVRESHGYQSIYFSRVSACEQKCATRHDRFARSTTPGIRDVSPFPSARSLARSLPPSRSRASLPFLPPADSTSFGIPFLFKFIGKLRRFWSREYSQSARYRRAPPPSCFPPLLLLLLLLPPSTRSFFFSLPSFSINFEFYLVRFAVAAASRLYPHARRWPGEPVLEKASREYSKTIESETPHYIRCPFDERFFFHSLFIIMNMERSIGKIVSSLSNLILPAIKRFRLIIKCYP